MAQKNSTMMRRYFRQIAGLDEPNARIRAKNSPRALGGSCVIQAAENIWNEYQKADCSAKYAISTVIPDQVVDIASVFDDGVVKIGILKAKTAANKFNAFEYIDAVTGKERIEFYSIKEANACFVIFANCSEQKQFIADLIEPEIRVGSTHSFGNYPFVLEKTNAVGAFSHILYVQQTQIAHTLDNLINTALDTINQADYGVGVENEVMTASDLWIFGDTPSNPNLYSKSFHQNRSVGLTESDTFQSKLNNAFNAFQNDSDIKKDKIYQQTKYLSSKNLKKLKQYLQNINGWAYYYNMQYSQEWSRFNCWGANDFLEWIDDDNQKIPEQMELWAVTDIGKKAVLNVIATGQVNSNGEPLYLFQANAADQNGAVGEFAFSTSPTLRTTTTQKLKQRELVDFIFKFNDKKICGNMVFNTVLNKNNLLVWENETSFDTNNKEQTTILELADDDNNIYQLIIDELNCCYTITGENGEIAFFDFQGNKINRSE
ncbi:MAG: hypothetical protein IJM09_04270 [Neisseriaceae bacterium]|nr:hypothetical protein [Neisseriaceae bacterium]